MKVKLIHPVQTVSGTIGDLTFFTRNGVTYARRKNRPTARPVTEQQITQQTHFKRIQQQVTEILHSVHLRAKYETEWKNQHKYTSLRGYIFSRLYAL